MSGNIVATKALIALSMKVAKYLYIIAAVIGVCYAAYYLFNVMERPIAGLLVFMGGFLIGFFYYVKWFMSGSGKPDMPVGLCPDFLTPISPGILAQSGAPTPAGGDSNTIYCMDFVGVSRNGQLRIADPHAIATQVKDTTWYSMPINQKNFLTTTGLQQIKSQVQAKGLTWVSLFPDI